MSGIPEPAQSCATCKPGIRTGMSGLERHRCEIWPSQHLKCVEDDAFIDSVEGGCCIEHPVRDMCCDMATRCPWHPRNDCSPLQAPRNKCTCHPGGITAVEARAVPSYPLKSVCDNISLQLARKNLVLQPWWSRGRCGRETCHPRRWKRGTLASAHSRVGSGERHDGSAPDSYLKIVRGTHVGTTWG